MHFMVGLLLAMGAVLLFVKFWRIFVPISVICIGLFMWVITGPHFQPPPVPPTPQEIAARIWADCHAGKIASGDPQCKKVWEADADRYVKAGEDAAATNYNSQFLRGGPEADAKAEEQEKQEQEKKATELREQQLWQAFLQTPVGMNASATAEDYKQKMGVALHQSFIEGGLYQTGSAAPMTSTQFDIYKQSVIDAEYVARQKLWDLWNLYRFQDGTIGVCFNNIQLSTSDVCKSDHAGRRRDSDGTDYQTMMKKMSDAMLRDAKLHPYIQNAH